MQDVSAPLSDEEMDAARRRIAGAAFRSPLVMATDGRTRLKLECLQPYGSFKIRGATNAVRAWQERGQAGGQVVSASAGNFGQAIVAAARRAGLPAVVHVPDNAARTKVERLAALGATVREQPFESWWAILQTRHTDDTGTFFHPVCEREVIAGAATIGLELIEDAPDLEAVFVPIGGGGLATGIAQGVKRLKPSCRIIAVETEASTPLTAARQAGRPVPVERRASFIDGMGGSSVLEEMWPLLQRLIDDVVVVSIADVEAAIRVLASQHHVIAEGAGAAAPAAAMRFGGPNAAAIVSGGNLDTSELTRILGQS
jgi:threonine dehydratase